MEGEGFMNPLRIVGVLLIVLGLAVLAYRGFSYTTRDKVIDMGAIEVTKEDRDFVAVPPLVGGAAVVAGAILLVAGGRKR